MSINVRFVKLFCIFFMYFFCNISYADDLSPCYESSNGKYYLCANPNWGKSCGYLIDGAIACHPCGVLWIPKTSNCYDDCAKESAVAIYKGIDISSLTQPDSTSEKTCIYGK